MFGAISFLKITVFSNYSTNTRQKVGDQNICWIIQLNSAFGKILWQYI